MKKLIFPALIITLGALTPLMATPAPTQTWSLNDVSLLMPFPASEEEAKALLHPANRGEKGTLLPDSLLQQIPNPFLVNITQEQALKLLKVVSVRLDPCYIKPSESALCIPMIRMSFQPLLANLKGAPSRYSDAALHAFYRLTPKEFKELSQRLKDLKSSYAVSSASLPLGVHPGIKTNGLLSDYFAKLKEIFLKYSGSKNQMRMTFMQLDGRTNVWHFGGFEIEGEKIESLNIPRLNSQKQSVKIHAQPPFQFDGGLEPEPPLNGDNLNELTRETASFIPGKLTANQEDLIRASYASALRIENAQSPEHTPETIDCGTCHVAQAVKMWSQHTFLEVQKVKNPFNFAGFPLFNFENQSPLKNLTNQLRAFGYMDQNISISQRTINESAVVADQMNLNY